MFTPGGGPRPRFAGDPNRPTDAEIGDSLQDVRSRHWHIRIVRAGPHLNRDDNEESEAYSRTWLVLFGYLNRIRWGRLSQFAASRPVKAALM